MLFHMMGIFGVRQPLMALEGGAGGAGGSGTPASGSGAPSGGSTQPSGTAPPSSGGQPNVGAAQSTSPSVFDLDDNTLIRVKGSDKPVKLSDYRQGFQSQFTKASQEAARLKKELQARDQRIQQIEQATRGGQQDPNTGGQAMLSEIENAPFIDGKTMAGVIRDFQGGVKERDMVMLAALNKIKQIEGILNELHGVNLNGQHEQKLKGWLRDGGYPDEAFELADIIYRGYEGDNLDQEFPDIFKARWAQMQKVLQTQQTRERERARTLPWTPGRGGNTGPGKPQGLSGRETPKELADIFFAKYGNQSDT